MQSTYPNPISTPSYNNTVEVYDRIAPEYVNRTLDADMTPFYDAVCTRLAPGSRVLDVGAGSGRDALGLTRRGMQVDILEPSRALLRDFKQREPGFPGGVYNTTMELARLPRRHYDGVLSCASLLHVKPEDWSRALQNLHQGTKPDGLLYLSIKKCPSGFDGEGRWFTGFDTLDALQEMVELSSSWKMTEGATTADSLGRDVVWFETWFKA